MLDIKRVRIACADMRGRISLKKFTDHDLFMVDVADDGIITLTPMVAMPQNVSERIDRHLGDPGSGVRVMRANQLFEERANA